MEMKYGWMRNLRSHAVCDSRIRLKGSTTAFCIPNET